MLYANKEDFNFGIIFRYSSWVVGNQKQARWPCTCPSQLLSFTSSINLSILKIGLSRCDVNYTLPLIRCTPRFRSFGGFVFLVFLWNNVCDMSFSVLCLELQPWHLILASCYVWDLQYSFYILALYIIVFIFLQEIDDCIKKLHERKEKELLKALEEEEKAFKQQQNEQIT